MSTPQTAQNHARVDLAHHPAMIVLLLNVIVAAIWAFRAPSPGLPLRMWVVLVSIALLVGSLKARTNALKAQDRTIRLEEQLRYATVLTPTTRALANTLPTRSLIALRFASDAELAPLVERAAAEHLTPKQIKASIAVWRPDTHRV